MLSANGVCNADCGHRDHNAGTKILIANVRYSNPYTEREPPPFEAVVVLDTIPPQHVPVLRLRAAEGRRLQV